MVKPLRMRCQRSPGGSALGGLGPRARISLTSRAARSSSGSGTGAGGLATAGGGSGAGRSCNSGSTASASDGAPATSAATSHFVPQITATIPRKLRGYYGAPVGGSRQDSGLAEIRQSWFFHWRMTARICSGLDARRCEVLAGGFGDSWLEAAGGGGGRLCAIIRTRDAHSARAGAWRHRVAIAAETNASRVVRNPERGVRARVGARAVRQRGRGRLRLQVGTGRSPDDRLPAREP